MSNIIPGLAIAFAVVVVLIVFAALFFSIAVTIATFFRGVRRLRFSLRSLMITVVSGGCCGSLLKCPHDSALFPVGVLLSEAYVMYLFVHILWLGSPREPSAPDDPQKERATP